MVNTNPTAHFLAGRITLVGAIVALAAAQAAGAAEVAVTQAQLEADWLRQARLRYCGGANALAAGAAVNWPTVLPVTIGRGRQLAAALQALAVDPGRFVAELDAVERELAEGIADRGEATWQAAYFRARRAIRGIALTNPLLDFDRILFVKRAATMFPHLSDQYYGWWARPGGGIFVLEDFKSAQATTRCLTQSWPEGNFLRPDLAHDATKVLFAFSTYHADVADVKNKRDKNNLPEDSFYHLFEMELATGAARQLTRGKYDDFDGRYLPSGEIVFLSTRKGQFIQTSRANTRRTLEADLPDSYVRCGGDDYRPVPVFTLHVMDRTGADLRPISAFETFEYTPSVAADGRVLYCRWDYIDRFNGFFFSLWSTNPDGTNPQLVYGNVTRRPQATFEPRSIPGSNKIVFTAAAHHSITGGSLALFDPAIGYEGAGPLTRLTPEVPFPEVERNVGMYYANPWPLSEDFYLVSWSDHKLPPHGRIEDQRNPPSGQGIYLYDRFGNLDLLYRDSRISSMTPMPVRPRKKPPALSSRLAWDGPQVGTMVLQDIYQGLEGLPPGCVKRLRIIGVLPKVQPRMNQPNLGVSHEETGKFVLGTVPVEVDGSAHFRVPSGVSLFFQALDQEGYAVQTMRSLTYVQPGQTLACIGCHEPRQTAPAPRAAAAVEHGPSRIEAGLSGTWPLRFDTLVQPVLDRHCVQCHDGDGAAATAAAGGAVEGNAEPVGNAVNDSSARDSRRSDRSRIRENSDNTADGPNSHEFGYQNRSRRWPAGRFDLTGGKAWQALISYADNDLHKLVLERDASVPGESPARRSALLRFLASDSRHRDLPLTDDDRRRLITWMDLYGQTQGSFSAEQEQRLEAFRARIHDLFK